MVSLQTPFGVIYGEPGTRNLHHYYFIPPSVLLLKANLSPLAPLLQLFKHHVDVDNSSSVCLL